MFYVLYYYLLFSNSAHVVSGYLTVIQTAMVPIGFPGPVHSKALHLDMYTSTAMLSAIVGVVNIVLLLVVFKEHVVVDDDFAPYSIQSKPTGKS